MTKDDLINEALKVAVFVTLSDDATAGGVGAALITDKGNLYTGICVDTKCSMGFCAEHNAIGSMLTHGEKNIDLIVAVNHEGQIYSPCGRCREFMYQISDNNKNTRIILKNNMIKTLSELLPEHWRD